MNRAAKRQISLELDRAIENLLRRRNFDQPVSIANMICRARAELPNLPLSDDELEGIIAREVVQRGGNIAFDRTLIQKFALPGH